MVVVDAQPEAIERLRAHPDARSRSEALETVLARFEDARWPFADLVNSSFSLPFCPPSAFEATWERILQSLRPGGRFCGQFFGVNDEWAPAADMTFLSRSEVDGLLDSLEVERLVEVEEDGRTAVGTPKHWHLFHVVARRP